MHPPSYPDTCPTAVAATVVIIQQRCALVSKHTITLSPHTYCITCKTFQPTYQLREAHIYATYIAIIFRQCCALDIVSMSFGPSSDNSGRTPGLHTCSALSYDIPSLHCVSWSLMPSCSSQCSCFMLQQHIHRPYWV